MNLTYKGPHACYHLFFYRIWIFLKNLTTNNRIFKSKFRMATQKKVFLNGATTFRLTALSINTLSIAILGVLKLCLSAPSKLDITRINTVTPSIVTPITVTRSIVTHNIVTHSIVTHSIVTHSIVTHNIATPE